MKSVYKLEVVSKSDKEVLIERYYSTREIAEAAAYQFSKKFSVKLHNLLIYTFYLDKEENENV